MNSFLTPTKRSSRKRVPNKFLAENYEVSGLQTSPPTKRYKPSSEKKSPSPSTSKSSKTLTRRTESIPKVKCKNGAMKWKASTEAEPITDKEESQESTNSELQVSSTGDSEENDPIAKPNRTEKCQTKLAKKVLNIIAETEATVDKPGEPDGLENLTKRVGVAETDETQVAIGEAGNVISRQASKSSAVNADVLLVSLQPLDHSWTDSMKSAMLSGKARIKVANNSEGPPVRINSTDGEESSFKHSEHCEAMNLPNSETVSRLKHLKMVRTSVKDSSDATKPISVDDRVAATKSRGNESTSVEGCGGATTKVSGKGKEQSISVVKEIILVESSIGATRPVSKEGKGLARTKEEGSGTVEDSNGAANPVPKMGEEPSELTGQRKTSVKGNSCSAKAISEKYKEPQKSSGKVRTEVEERKNVKKPVPEEGNNLPSSGMESTSVENTVVKLALKNVKEPVKSSGKETSKVECRKDVKSSVQEGTSRTESATITGSIKVEELTKLSGNEKDRFHSKSQEIIKSLPKDEKISSSALRSRTLSPKESLDSSSHKNRRSTKVRTDSRSTQEISEGRKINHPTEMDLKSIPKVPKVERNEKKELNESRKVKRKVESEEELPAKKIRSDSCEGVKHSKPTDTLKVTSPAKSVRNLTEVDLFAGLELPKSASSPRKRRDSSTEKRRTVSSCGAKSPRSEANVSERRVSGEATSESSNSMPLSYKPKKSWLEMAATENYTVLPQPTFAGDNPWFPNRNDLEEVAPESLRSSHQELTPKPTDPRLTNKAYTRDRKLSTEEQQQKLESIETSEKIQKLALAVLSEGQKIQERRKSEPEIVEQNSPVKPGQTQNVCILQQSVASVASISKSDNMPCWSERPPPLPVKQMEQTLNSSSQKLQPVFQLTDNRICSAFHAIQRKPGLSYKKARDPRSVPGPVSVDTMSSGPGYKPPGAEKILPLMDIISQSSMTTKQEKAAPQNPSAPPIPLALLPRMPAPNVSALQQRLTATDKGQAMHQTSSHAASSGKTGNKVDEGLDDVSDSSSSPSSSSQSSSSPEPKSKPHSTTSATDRRSHHRITPERARDAISYKTSRKIVSCDRPHGGAKSERSHDGAARQRLHQGVSPDRSSVSPRGRVNYEISREVLSRRKSIDGDTPEKSRGVVTSHSSRDVGSIEKAGYGVNYEMPLDGIASGKSRLAVNFQKSRDEVKFEGSYVACDLTANDGNDVRQDPHPNARLSTENRPNTAGISVKTESRKSTSNEPTGKLTDPRLASATYAQGRRLSADEQQQKLDSIAKAENIRKMALAFLSEAQKIQEQRKSDSENTEPSPLPIPERTQNLNAPWQVMASSPNAKAAWQPVRKMDQIPDFSQQKLQPVNLDNLAITSAFHAIQPKPDLSLGKGRDPRPVPGSSVAVSVDPMSSGSGYKLPGAGKIVPLMDIISKPSFTVTSTLNPEQTAPQNPSAPPIPLALLPRMPGPDVTALQKRLNPTDKGRAMHQTSPHTAPSGKPGNKVDEGLDDVSASSSSPGSSGKTSFIHEPTEKSCELNYSIYAKSWDYTTFEKSREDFTSKTSRDVTFGRSHDVATDSTLNDKSFVSRTQDDVFSRDNLNLKVSCNTATSVGSESSKRTTENISVPTEQQKTRKYELEIPSTSVANESTIEKHLVHSPVPMEVDAQNPIKMEIEEMSSYWVRGSTGDDPERPQSPEEANNYWDTRSTPTPSEQSRSASPSKSESSEMPSHRTDSPSDVGTTSEVKLEPMDTSEPIVKKEVLEDGALPSSFTSNVNVTTPPSEKNEIVVKTDAVVSEAKSSESFSDNQTAKRLQTEVVKKKELRYEDLDTFIGRLKNCREVQKYIMISETVNVELIGNPLIDSLDEETVETNGPYDGLLTVPSTDLRVARKPMRVKNGSREPITKPKAYIIKTYPKTLTRRRNDVYVTKKTDFNAQIEKCRSLFDQGFTTVYVHGLGPAANRVIELGLKLRSEWNDAMTMSVHTQSVTLEDEIFTLCQCEGVPSPSFVERNQTAVHVTLSMLNRDNISS